MERWWRQDTKGSFVALARVLILIQSSKGSIIFVSFEANATLSQGGSSCFLIDCLPDSSFVILTDTPKEKMLRM